MSDDLEDAFSLSIATMLRVREEEVEVTRDKVKELVAGGMNLSILRDAVAREYAELHQVDRPEVLRAWAAQNSEISQIKRAYLEEE